MSMQMEGRQTSPHERINFNLRPAKRVERKMVADVLATLARYHDPSQFGYIGMGAYYFADFIVMHKAFGIESMISIESDEEHRERFEFNKPYACIQMAYGLTHEVLPTLSLFAERPVIVWLDYYGPLVDAILGDAQEVARRCQPGSVFLVTVNGQPPASKKKRADWEQQLTATNRPADYGKYTETQLAVPEIFAEICRQALEMRLESVCSDRNAAEKQVSLRQILNIRYRDGQPMLTFGWIFPSPEQEAMIDRAPRLMDTFPISRDSKVVNLDTPVLTFREIAHLRAKMPGTARGEAFLKAVKPIQKEVAEQFAAIYRYFPSFAHIEE